MLSLPLQQPKKINTKAKPITDQHNTVRGPKQNALLIVQFHRLCGSLALPSLRASIIWIFCATSKMCDIHFAFYNEWIELYAWQIIPFLSLARHFFVPLDHSAFFVWIFILVELWNTQRTTHRMNTKAA